MFKKIQYLVLACAVLFGLSAGVMATMPGVDEIWNQNGQYTGPISSKLRITLGTTTLPTTNACGTNTITGSDSNMTVVISSGTPATCAINFGTAWSTAPTCWYNDQTTANANGGKVSASTTVVTVTLPTFTGAAANLATDTVNIWCMGKS